jgi:hypothetical protein
MPDRRTLYLTDDMDQAVKDLYPDGTAKANEA